MKDYCERCQSPKQFDNKIQNRSQLEEHHSPPTYLAKRYKIKQKVYTLCGGCHKYLTEIFCKVERKVCIDFLNYKEEKWLDIIKDD